MKSGNGQVKPDYEFALKSRQRLVALIIALISCLGLTILAFHQARSWEEALHQAEFEHQAGTHTVIIQKTIDAYVELIEGIGGLFAASQKVGRDEFAAFVRPLLKRHKGIQGLGWNPRVPDSEREAFEATARLEGLPGFHFKELDANGEMVVARRRAEYIPAFYLEPFDGNEKALGYDIASEDIRREALENARDHGKAVTTRWIRLVQEPEDRYGILVVRPVYTSDTIPDNVQHRRKDLMGYVVAVLRVDYLIEEALQQVEPAGLDFWVHEGDHPELAATSYYHPSRTRSDDVVTPYFDSVAHQEGLQYLTPLNLPGRQWSVMYSPAPAFHGVHENHASLVILVFGILITALLAISLLSILRSTQRTASLNRRLSVSKSELEDEVAERRQAEQALCASERKYRALIENATEAITILDVERGCLIEANRHAEQLFRMTREELLRIGPADFSPEVQPDGRSSETAAREYIQKAVDGETPVFEWMHKKANGQEFPCEIRLIRLPDSSRVLVRGIVIDISERMAAQQALRESERYNRTLFEKSPIGLALCGMNGEFVDVNQVYASILGRTIEETRSLTYMDVTPDKYAHEDNAQVAKLDKTGSYGPYEKEFIHKDGHLVPVRLYARIIEKDGKNYIWSSVEDITAYKQMRERLDHMAFHDALTDLPNRELLHDRLSHAISLALRNSSGIGVLFLDIDRFKTINDSMGHTAGDHLLKLAAQRLRDTVREADTIARFGGDEFVVIVEQIYDQHELEGLAKKIIECMREPFYMGSRALYATASIGISLCCQDGSDVDALIAQADSAMYDAKESGRNTYRFYSPQMAERAFIRTDMESDLRGALEREELTFHLQPIISMDTQKTVSVEALMRWKSPERGLVSPDKFIPLMEESGMIVPVSRWMLEQSCRFAEVVRSETQSSISLAVNFSATCFYDPDVVDFVRKTLDKTSTEACQLTIEITESTLFQVPQRVRPVLAGLKAMGVRIALDDFGTGQSSLNHLRNFPIDIVKIDREFTRDIPGDRKDCELVSAIIAMAHNLNMSVVAEGVETDVQLAYLRQCGCDCVQGYYFSPPLPGDELLAYMFDKSRKQASSS